MTQPWGQQDVKQGRGWGSPVDNWGNQPFRQAQSGYQIGSSFVWGQSPSAYPVPQQPNPNRLKHLLGGLMVTILLLVGLLAGIVLLADHTPTSGETPYINEKYQAPPVEWNPAPIPWPRSQEEIDNWLKENKLYDQKVPRPVKCKNTKVNPATASKSDLEKHLDGLVACLMGQWHQPIADAGFVMPRPSVTVYETSVTTACGKLPMKNAVYCSLDQQIYYAKDLFTIIPSGLSSAHWIAESVIAHEFGHAVQARTGVLPSYYMLASSASKADRNALSRRIELQADCYAGTFIDSSAHSVNLTSAAQAKISEFFFSLGDDQLSGEPNIDGTHGHGDNRKSWLTDGYTADKFSACNTFTASEERTK